MSMSLPARLDEYMRTSYSPDCEFIDGRVVERNTGRGKHSYAQAKLANALNQLLDGRRLMSLIAVRVQVAPFRIRVPDVCVVKQLEEVITVAPSLCVEVLSPDDRWTRVNERIRDYQSMGVECVWVIDPYARRAWIFQNDHPPQEVHDGKLVAERLGIELALADVLPS
jgi:Uma2 family endonuclease